MRGVAGYCRKRLLMMELSGWKRRVMYGCDKEGYAGGWCDGRGYMGEGKLDE